MNIYIDKDFKICSIEESDNPEWICYQVDREATFSDMSDFRILCSKCIPKEGGYIVVPAIEDELIRTLERAYSAANRSLQDTLDTLILTTLEVPEHV